MIKLFMALRGNSIVKKNIKKYKVVMRDNPIGAWVVNVPTEVNVRYGPGIAYMVRYTLKLNDRVMVLGAINGTVMGKYKRKTKFAPDYVEDYKDWYVIKHDNKLGFILSDYLTV